MAGKCLGCHSVFRRAKILNLCFQGYYLQIWSIKLLQSRNITGNPRMSYWMLPRKYQKSHISPLLPQNPEPVPLTVQNVIEKKERKPLASLPGPCLPTCSTAGRARISTLATREKETNKPHDTKHTHSPGKPPRGSSVFIWAYLK